MRSIFNILYNLPLICAILSWFIAQVIKFLIAVIVQRRFSMELLLSSGGMPSSHSATVCALSAAVVCEKGITSVEFAISFVLAFIVMYDAAGVRRAAGEQAKMLNGLMRDIQEGHADDMQRELKELIGHTPLQVAAGAALGIVVTAIIYYGIR